VKAHQLSDIIAGVDPIRSVVKVGTGVADLVLLPIAAYQKDKRVMKGIRRGAKSFMKSTALETVMLGARLATGTQVILEGAENVLGAEGWNGDLLAETVSNPSSSATSLGTGETAGLISRYADQPLSVKEGLQSAYKSVSKNFNLAGQTILALPMEIHERSGTDVRSVCK
jgi:autophagy-related protein 2